MKELNAHAKTKDQLSDMEVRIKQLEEDLLKFSDDRDNIEKLKTIHKIITGFFNEITFYGSNLYSNFLPAAGCV